MNMLDIPVKYKNKDMVYTIEKVKPSIACHVCEEVGRISYKDKDMKCPECSGKGYYLADKAKNIAIEKPVTVTQTKITINSNDELTVKYRVTDGLRLLNRSQENLFNTLDEAQKRCDELNAEFKIMNIKDIVIQDIFKEHEPHSAKVLDKLAYYNENGEFNSQIIVDSNNVLQDGYINYLLYKTLKIDEIKVSIT